MRFTPTNLRRVIIEDNLFDLPAPSGMPGTFPTAVGIKFSVTSQTGAAIFVFVFIRSNRIRGLNGWAVWQGSMGMELSNIGNLMVENNIVDIDTTDALKAIQTWDCGKVQAFNNRRSTGELIEIYNPTTSRRVSELTTEAENVLLGL